MSEILKVGMADLKICKAPDGLTTLGLGSCVGIALRDPVTGIGGLAHVMLPESTAFRNSSGNKAKYADTAIIEMVRQMEMAGAQRIRLVAKVAGGATMFSFQNKSDLVRIGDQNINAVRKTLGEIKIPILAEDVGDSYGRTVIFYPETGEYVIKTVGKAQKSI